MPPCMISYLGLRVHRIKTRKHNAYTLHDAHCLPCHKQGLWHLASRKDNAAQLKCWQASI